MAETGDCHSHCVREDQRQAHPEGQTRTPLTVKMQMGFSRTSRVAALPKDGTGFDEMPALNTHRVVAQMCHQDEDVGLTFDEHMVAKRVPAPPI